MAEATKTSSHLEPKGIDRRIAIWGIVLTVALAGWGVAAAFYFDWVPKSSWGAGLVVLTAIIVASIVAIARAAQNKAESFRVFAVAIVVAASTGALAIWRLRPEVELPKVLLFQDNGNLRLQNMGKIDAFLRGLKYDGLPADTLQDPTAIYADTWVGITIDWSKDSAVRSFPDGQVFKVRYYAFLRDHLGKKFTENYLITAKKTQDAAVPTITQELGSERGDWIMPCRIPGDVQSD